MDLDRRGKKDDLLQTNSFPVLLAQGLESNDFEMLNVSISTDFQWIEKIEAIELILIEWVVII